MTFQRVTAKYDSRQPERPNRIPRVVCVTLLSLFYLVSNTAVLPGLDQGKSCRCADQLKTKSQCCCFNSTLDKKTATAGSCCTAGKQTVRSCCSQQGKQTSDSRPEPRDCQISSLCGCGNSTKNGLYTSLPRHLSPRPTLVTPIPPRVHMTFANDTPVVLAYAPDTPPPQSAMR